MNTLGTPAALVRGPLAAALLGGALLGGAWLAGGASPTDVTVAVPGRPFAAIPSSDGRSLFVSLFAPHGPGGSLLVLQSVGDTFAAGRTWPQDSAPSGLALSHDARVLAVARGADALLLDTARLASGRSDPTLRRVAELRGAIYAAFSPDDRWLAISEEGAARVTLVDRSQPDRAPLRVAVGRAPVGLAFSPDGRWLYVTSEAAPGPGACAGDRPGQPLPQGTVTTIRVSGSAPPTAVAQAVVGCAPVRIVLSGDGMVAFVSLRGENHVATFDTAELRAGLARRLASLGTGPAPVGLALSQDGRFLVIADSDRFQRGALGHVECVRVGHDGGMTEVTRSQSGLFPREVTALPGGRRWLVTQFRSQMLQVLIAYCDG